MMDVMTKSVLNKTKNVQAKGKQMKALLFFPNDRIIWQNDEEVKVYVRKALLC